MTITFELEIPDTGNLAEILAPMSPQERNNYAVSALHRQAEEEAELLSEERDSLDLPEEVRTQHYAAIAAGIADFEAGRHRPMSEFFAELRAERASGKSATR